jgi:hypothetical protein
MADGGEGSEGGDTRQRCALSVEFKTHSRAGHLEADHEKEGRETRECCQRLL